MTSFEPVIRGMRVAAFRGFRDVHEFDLSATAVIITGPNGTGKTSFFDALQWALLGTIERLESLRSRRNAEHIVNQYRLGSKAWVEVDLSLSSGESVTIRRSGDQGGNTLELRRQGEQPLFGPEAESTLRKILLPYSDQSLESALTTSGLMQQDVMRRVLEAKPADRYRHMSTVLGLGALEDFEEAARSVAKQASDREKIARSERTTLAESLQEAMIRSEAAKARLATRPQVAAVRGETLKTLRSLPSGLTLREPVLALHGPEDAQFAATEYGRTIEAFESAQFLLDEASHLQAGLGERPTPEQLAALRDELARAQSAKEAAEATRGIAQTQLNAARRVAADMAKLAALAVPLLSDQCPVCGQGIDHDYVEGKLRERSEETETILQLEREFVERANDFARSAESAAAAAEQLASAEQTAKRWEKVKHAEAVAADAVKRALEESAVVQFDGVDYTQFVAISSAVLQYFVRARRALHDLLDVFERQTGQGETDRADAEVRSLEVALEASERRLAAESARARRLQRLAEVTTGARVEVTESRLRSIQPLVANIFQRLDPHPAFKTVDFELSTYYRRGTTSPLVIDHVENVSADPLLIFSTSQANIVALSYFIAMSLSLEQRGLPFLLLDDPVQSMDDVNVLGFADLCRHLRLQRQLIISTHERRFARLLERKLAPRVEDVRTKVITFAGWDRSGPTVREHFVEPELLEDPIRLTRLAV